MVYYRGMKQAFYDMPKAALNLIFPLYCQGCEKPLQYNNKFFLCTNCFGKLNNPAAFSSTFGESFIFFEKAYHCCPYEGMIRDLIHKFKYGKKAFLKNAFIYILHNLFTEKIASNKIDIIMPVPMYHKDEKKRGFNQSCILAEGLTEKTGIAFQNTLLKPKKTLAQAGLNKAERLKNIKNAFSCKKQQYLYNKNILLIDDVFTTGATISECAGILKAHGAGTVLALTIAKGI
jgi:competence protein ComFC